MKVLRASSLAGLQEGVSGPCSVTIGNFDGCHKGHIQLLQKACSLAVTTQSTPAVLTFSPHPREFFQPGLKVAKLFQPEQKIRALEEIGIQLLYIQSFDHPFSQLSPEEFCRRLLASKLQAKSVVVGEDFRFGVQRKGSVEDLRNMLGEAAVSVVPQQFIEGKAVSSSEIRCLIKQADIQKANKLLGRPYLLEGVVRKGQQLGRKLGFPTANLQIGEQLLPGHGVYAGWAVRSKNCPIFGLPATKIPCVLNIGTRPTVHQDNRAPSIEVHLLNGDYGENELYDENVGIYLTNFIRSEQRFPSLEELRLQIQSDCNTARVMLSR